MTRFSNEVLEIFRAILKWVAPDVSSLPPLGRLTKQKNRFGVTLGKKIVMRAKFCHYASIRLLLRPKTKSRIRHFGNSAKMMHWRPNATKRHRKMSSHSSAWKRRRRKIIIAPTCEFIHGNYLNFVAALLIRKVWWWGGSSSKEKKKNKKKKYQISNIFLQMVFWRTI